MELLKYINNLNKVDVTKAPTNTTMVKDLIYDFIYERGYNPSCLFLTPKKYHELEREVAYLPTWKTEWQVDLNRIVFCNNIVIEPAALRDEHSILIR